MPLVLKEAVGRIDSAQIDPMGGKPYITLHPKLQNLPHNLRGAMSNIPNDEPTLVDHLDHCSIAKHIRHYRS